MYDIEDDRMDGATEILREWKGAMRMNKHTIASDQFDGGYDETYKVWLNRNIQSISSPFPNSCHSVEEKKSKVVIELREVKWGAQEIHAKFFSKINVLSTI